MVECDKYNEALQLRSLKGSKANNRKILFIVHNTYETPVKDLYEKEVNEISVILKHCGLSLDDIFLTNFIKSSSINENDEEQLKCKKRLEKEIRNFEPERIVVFSENTPAQSREFESKKYIIGYPNPPYPDTPALVMPSTKAMQELGNEKISEYNRIKRFLKE